MPASNSGVQRVEVDVLDAQQEPAAGLRGHPLVEQRRIGMAEMQVAIRARREAEDGPVHRRAACQERSRFRIVAGHRQIATAVPELAQGRRMRRISTLDDIAAGLDALCAADPRLVAVRAMAGEVPLRLIAARLRQPRLDRRVAAGVARQRRRDLRPAGHARRSADAGRRCLPPATRCFARPACRGPSSARCWRCRRPCSTGSTSTASATSTARKRSALMRRSPASAAGRPRSICCSAAGHPDVFPARDVALQSAVGHALGIDPRPGEKALIWHSRIMVARGGGSRRAFSGPTIARSRAGGRAAFT